MTVEIRYQSKGGNTKAVVEVISSTVGVQAESIDSNINEYVDKNVVAWTLCIRFNWWEAFKQTNY